MCRGVGRSTFSFYIIEIFYTEIVILTKISLIQNSFVVIHNKMFRAGAKTLVVSGNLKHISGLDMH